MLFSVSRALKGELFDKDEVALIEKFMRMAIVEGQNITSRKVRLKFIIHESFSLPAIHHYLR